MMKSYKIKKFMTGCRNPRYSILSLLDQPKLLHCYFTLCKASFPVIAKTGLQLAVSACI